MRFLLTSLLLFCSLLTRAQNNYVFKHLNIEDGLSQSSVLTIAQDARGFMWFGTRFGLNKYNSRSFKSYKGNKDIDNSLVDSYVLSLLVAKDSSLWVGTVSGLHKYNEAKDNFEQIKHNDTLPASISNNTINCIFQDSKSRIWMGTADGLNLWLPKTFSHFLLSSKVQQKVYTIAEDHTGTIWLGTTDGLMSMTITKGKPVVKLIKPFSYLLNLVNDNHVTSIIEDRNNNLWIGTKQTGLSKLDLRTGNISTYSYSSLNPNSVCSNNIRKIILDKDGKLWIGTIHGISVYDPGQNKFSTLQNEPGNIASLSQNSVYDIFQDRQGIIWVGTYYGGINMIYPNYTPFKVYKSAKNNSGLSSNVVGPIKEDTQHNLWIGTEGEGLNYLDRKSNTYTHYKYNPNNPASLSSNLVKSIFEDKQKRIWVGTHLGGLNLFMPGTNSFKRYTNKKNDPFSLSNDEITMMFEDSHGRFWIGTNGGLNLFDRELGKFSLDKAINGGNAINYIFEDSKQTVWVAASSGLYKLEANANNFVYVPKVVIDGQKRELTNISCIAEDKIGNLWLGTFRTGLIKFDTRTKHYSLTLKKDGLPSDNITGILEDDKQNLWVSTDNGLCKFNPQHQTFKIYNIADDLPGNEFNYRSSLKDSRGEFFFGGLNGLISFFPSQITENKVAPKAIFTDLKLFGKSVRLDDEDGPLENNISNTDAVTFASSQNVFSVDFTILNFIKSDKNRYAYKLEGFEKNWNYVNVPSASYTNLSPGNYTLLVKGSNNDGVWTSETSTLGIKILPPFYKTWWAYLIYSCIVAGILFLLLRYLLVKTLLRKEKEVNEHKLAFFTHISHEIRTPLTLIVGPLGRLIENTKDDAMLSNDLQPIKNNADRLMNLVTELLDFRKAETGKMTLQISPGNLVKFSQEIFMAFQNMAITEGISYSFESAKKEIEMYFDKMQLEKVLFNLLSNAFKFNHRGGKISLSIEEDGQWVNIHVTDNGKGIPIDKKANLFTDFYQANPSTNIGTGLGLSLSKSIVELHHGTIDFESAQPETDHAGRTCFTISLRKGKDHFKAGDFIKDYIYYDDVANYSPKAIQEQETVVEEVEMSAPLATTKKYTLLIVEDNEEVRLFIKNLLEPDYHIAECENGLQGWESALELMPDLIISDVMMPIMDGLELCRKIKTDERTSHIPVVLLTARSAYVHQVNGFENGADSYIMKPFNPKILQLNIHNLLNAREIIRQKFAQVVTLEPQNLIINTTEQNFLTKTIRIIEEHMGHPDFDVPTLASEIGMSQPILYKKIRALTGLSVNDFIKSLRLKKAAQMLEAGVGNIASIAYSVGFSDRKYFSLEFKKQFGKSPTEYLESLAKKDEEES